MTTASVYPLTGFPRAFPYSWASDYGEDEHGIYLGVTLAGVRQGFRWIPPGTFWMGSQQSEPQRNEDEERHRVQLTQGFWLMDTAMTQALWQVVMDENPSHFKGQDLPVETVSWHDVATFLERVQLQYPQLALRLPTEAEWEYACRAGTQTPFSFGSQIDSQQVNFNGEHPYADGKASAYREKTLPVKALPANAWGLYQMHGNVWEWCSDWYGAYPAGDSVDPSGPQQGQGRVLRGGSWIYDARCCRAAYRFVYEPDFTWNYSGFRLALGWLPYQAGEKRD